MSTTFTLPTLYVYQRPTRGLLFVGDPHIWSKRPGRRRDESFLTTVLGKLSQAADIANTLDLWPVFLGDLFHEDNDHDPQMLVPVTRVLQRFDRKPVTLVGNHEKDEWILKERNALALLRVTQQIDTIENNGFWARIELTGDDGRVHTVAVGGTPYGQTIPRDLGPLVGLPAVVDEQPPTTTESAAPGKAQTLGAVSESPAVLDMPDAHRAVHEALGVQSVVWVTHDDLAFEGAYPGSKALHPINGVDLMVNGHMHGTKQPVRSGYTACYNPGNITRLSVDMAEHVPSVWSWTPFDNPGMPSAQGVRVPALMQHVLEHQTGAAVFNFEGRHARASLLEPDALMKMGESAFVALMKQDHTTQRTDDGHFVRESLQEVVEELKVVTPVQTILEDLLARALSASEDSA